MTLGWATSIARAVAADQHVGGQQIGVAGDEFAQADRAAFLAGLQHQLQVEAEFAVALREDRLERGQVQRVLALVVGTAATVPAIGFLGKPPGIEAGTPLVFQPAYRVAVAAWQHPLDRGDRKCQIRLKFLKDL